MGLFMTFSLQKTGLFLVLFSIQAYSYAPQAVSATKKDVTLTAQALSADECVDMFYSDLRDDRIYPIALSIQNNTDKTLKISPENVVINGATLLTSKKLDSEISAMHMGTVFFTVVFFPIAFYTNYQAAKLNALKPIIKRFSLENRPMVIQPHQTLETMVFAEVDFPRDANGEIQSFIAPEYFDVTVTLKNNSFFSLQAPIVFNLHIPTI